MSSGGHDFLPGVRCLSLDSDEAQPAGKDRDSVRRGRADRARRRYDARAARLRQPVPAVRRCAPTSTCTSAL